MEANNNGETVDDTVDGKAMSMLLDDSLTALTMVGRCRLEGAANIMVHQEIFMVLVLVDVDGVDDRRFRSLSRYL